MVIYKEFLDYSLSDSGLARALPETVAAHNLSFDKRIKIPDEVNEKYSEIGRVTPMMRARNLEKVCRILAGALKKGIISGSATFMRQELGNALIYFSENYQLPHIRIVGEKFIEVSAKWRSLGRLLYLSRPIDNYSSFWFDIDNYIEDIFSFEKDTMHLLEAITEKLLIGDDLTFGK